ncbi:MAG TPA: hypothetical protein VMW41_03955 [Candidatus Bathyarchaeia archaeon]|nr:hypothetical protein [Candidatus Bathyarchaeia archaeon]
MKKSIPFIIIIVFLGFGLLIGRNFIANKKPKVTTDIASKSQPSENKEESYPGKLKDILSLGKSVKCTWKTSENNQGTAFVRDNKIFTEARLGEKKVYSLLLEDCVYSWEEGQASGVKFCSDTKQNNNQDIVPDTFSWEDSNTSYQCDSEIVPETKFNPPENINFISPQDLLKGN